MNPIVLGIILILVYIYVSYYYRYPKNVKVLQASEGKLNPSLFLEKQPIILLDVQHPLEKVKQDLLPYRLTRKVSYEMSTWNTNPTKYLFIHSETSTEIHLLPAAKKLNKMKLPDPDETLITIQLLPSQILILPFHWHYHADVSLELLGVHDYISWILP
jgi:hypothetical protein